MAGAPAETAGSERYLKACRKLAVTPEPVLLRTLRAPFDHGCAYSTLAAEEPITEEGVRAIIAALDTCRHVHVVCLAGLRRGRAARRRRG